MKSAVMLSVGLFAFALLCAAAGLACTRANRETGDLMYRSGVNYGKQNQLPRPGPNGRYVIVDVVGTGFLLASLACVGIAIARLFTA